MNLQKLYFYWLIPTMYTAWLITGELLPKLYKSLLCVARVTQKLARQFSWPHTAGAWTRLFSASFNLNIFKVNMGTHILIEDGQTGQRPNNFLSNLLDFCVDSATTCLSPAADKLCVPIGLCALSALLLLLSCFLLVHQRYKFRTENPGETTLFLYCFLGDMCSTVGAILSRQLHIQILMGAFAAAMNAVQFMSCCFQVLLCRNSKSGKRWRMMRKRRRQHLLAVSILMVVGGGFLKSGVTHYYYTPTVDRPVNGRKVLHVSLQWDFEEAHTQWNELAAKQRHEFLLHEWPKTLKSFNTYVVSGLPQKALSGTEESVLVPAATLEN
ncbi:transmembrane protein 44 isoform X5 [Channa argus]|uniref:transmembrane protein 44 isoform X5 n=1 Tax=Channa argus TaxID=215402 RepID=UPI0035217D09